MTPLLCTSMAFRRFTPARCTGLVTGLAALATAPAMLRTAGHRWMRSVRRDIYNAPRPAAPLELPAGMVVLGGLEAGHLAVFAPPSTPGAATLVFLHGNGHDVGEVLPRLSEWRTRGYGVALVEYPGYGELQRLECTQQLLMDSTEAAVREVMAQPGVGVVMLVGLSLGTAVGVELAARGLGSCLMLNAPFTSIADVTRCLLPVPVPRWVPLQLLLGTERLDSLTRSRDVQVPSMVLHGDGDELFPVSMGRRLAAALPNCEFVEVPGATHASILQSVMDHVPDLLARVGGVGTRLGRPSAQNP